MAVGFENCAAISHDRHLSSSALPITRASKGLKTKEQLLIPMSTSLLGILVATASCMLIGVNAHSNGVGSCAAGFEKFPVGTEHNWQESTRPGGALGDNYGDVAFSGMTLTLGETQLQRPSGSDQFHYTGECNANYLCGKCQGACEDDTGCAEGLQCFVREADEAVPGCSGTIGLWDGTSYCYDPTAEAAAGRRQLQGQEAQVDATFQVGTPYTLKLEAPADALFKGFMFRLEGEDGQDLSGAIETVSENMQVLDSTGEINDIEGAGVTITTMCAPTVAAVCHTEAEEKDMVEALITVPEAGKANLEVTVMVGEHQWYLTNYVLQFESGHHQHRLNRLLHPCRNHLLRRRRDETVSESPPTTEGETTSVESRQTMLSVFATVVLVGLGLALLLIMRLANLALQDNRRISH